MRRRAFACLVVAGPAALPMRRRAFAFLVMAARSPRWPGNCRIATRGARGQASTFLSKGSRACGRGSRSTEGACPRPPPAVPATRGARASVGSTGSQPMAARSAHAKRRPQRATFQPARFRPPSQRVASQPCAPRATRRDLGHPPRACEGAAMNAKPPARAHRGGNARNLGLGPGPPGRVARSAHRPTMAG